MNSSLTSLIESGLEKELAESKPKRRRVSLPVSKAAIASRLSLTPEYFSRVLNELETAGLIQVDKRDIRIPDTARLANHQPL